MYLYPSSLDFLAVVGKSVSSISGVSSVVEGSVEAVQSIVSVVASASPAVVSEAESVVSVESEAGVSIIGGERSDPEAGHRAEVLRDSLGGQTGQGGQGSRHGLMNKDDYDLIVQKKKTLDNLIKL